MRSPAWARRRDVDGSCDVHGYFLAGPDDCLKCLPGAGAVREQRSPASWLDVLAEVLDVAAAEDPGAVEAGRLAAQARAMAALYRRSSPVWEAGLDDDIGL